MDFENSEVRSRVESLLAASFGDITGLTYLRSNRNHVYKAEFAGERTFIVKLPGSKTGIATFRREVELLKLLARSPIPVPAVVFDSGSDLIVMDYIQGETLEEYTRQAGKSTEPAWRETGQLAARFVEVPLGPMARYLAPRWSGLDQIAEKLREYDLWQPPFPEIIAAAGQILYKDPACFIHADFGPGQVLVGTHGQLAIIDWENAAAGSALTPLARCIALTREYIGDEGCISWLVAGYEEICPLTSEQRHELHLHEMISHLSDINWKLGWQPEHHNHALALARRVASWYEALKQHD
jgi:Ser/Thr protein kinase RdoA (MazF antagonist)